MTSLKSPASGKKSKGRDSCRGGKKPAISKRLKNDKDFNIKLAYAALQVTQAFVNSLEELGYEIRKVQPRRITLEAK